jgi:hypothetical protein
VEDKQMSERGCRDPEMAGLLGAYELGLLSRGERSRVEDHILHCSECFEDLYETASLGSLVLGKKTGVQPGRRRWFIPVVTAAMLFLAFVTTFRFIGTHAEVKRGSHAKDTTISLLGPRGATRGSQIPFRWQSPESVKYIILTVFDEGGDSIWSFETADEAVTVDIEKDPRLEPRHTYYWKVMGKDEAGRLVAASPVRSFSIETE